MASQGLFSIGGIASGLDTTGIIEQLMALERQPVTKLQSTQAQLRRTDDAWVQVSTRLSALRTATDAIARPDRFTSMVAVSSSNTDVATVTRAGTNATGSLTFSVRKLAAAHQVSVSGASADQQRDLTEPVRLRVGSGEVIDLSEELGASASLTQIASAINGRKAGVTASVVKVDDAETRLILTSGRTGTEHGLTVEGLGATQTLRAAADAELVIGEGAGAVTLTRSSNTITDLVPGASVTLRRTTPVDAPITVTAARDVDAGVTAVKSYVDALNGTLRTLKDLTAYDGETGRAGPLQGDATARRLQDVIRNAVTAPSGLSAGLSAGFQVGLSVGRDGTVQLDEAKLRQALTDDIGAVGRLFGRTATATDAAAVAPIGTARTAAGTYEVGVTRAAEVARVTGAVFVPHTDVEPKTFRISSGGRTATVTINTEHATAEGAAQAIRAALAEAGIGGLVAGVTAGADGERLTLETTAHGSAAAFTIEEDVAGSAPFALGRTQGVDVAGRWRPAGSTDEGAWQAMRGAGQELTATSGAANGISITWTGAADQTFSVTYTHGLAGNMSNTLRTAEGLDGLVARARDGITNQIKIYQTRIDGFDQRLATRESTLRRQFTAMEAALGAMNAQMSWLSSQISSLDGLRPPR